MLLLEFIREVAMAKDTYAPREVTPNVHPEPFLERSFPG